MLDATPRVCLQQVGQTPPRIAVAALCGHVKLSSCPQEIRGSAARLSGLNAWRREKRKHDKAAARNKKAEEEKRQKEEAAAAAAAQEAAAAEAAADARKARQVEKKAMQKQRSKLRTLSASLVSSKSFEDDDVELICSKSGLDQISALTDALSATSCSDNQQALLQVRPASLCTPCHSLPVLCSALLLRSGCRA